MTKSNFDTHPQHKAAPTPQRVCSPGSKQRHQPLVLPGFKRNIGVCMCVCARATTGVPSSNNQADHTGEAALKLIPTKTEGGKPAHGKRPARRTTRRSEGYTCRATGTLTAATHSLTWVRMIVQYGSLINSQPRRHACRLVTAQCCPLQISSTHGAHDSFSKGVCCASVSRLACLVAGGQQHG